jgi:hypothetical protein
VFPPAFVTDRRDRQDHDERRALPLARALRPDRAAVQVDELFDDREPQAEPSVAPGTFNFAGQSLVIPGGGSFNNLRFNWYTFAGSPAAFGTLYLLTQEYLGLPGDLSPSTPGFVARSETIVDNQYRFAPGITLTGGTQYWVYTDTQGSFVTSFFGSTYAGGDLYLTGVPTLPFRKAIAAPGVFLDANFRLQGSAVPAP